MSKAPDADSELFSEAMRGVVRRKETEHVTLTGKRLSTRPLQQEADDRAVLRELLADPDPDTVESGDVLLYRAPGVQESVLRRLRRGQIRIERELDLHGHNRERARGEVAVFLAECHDQGVRCVRIIHGKGNRSPNSGPVLKSLLDGWLRKRRNVLAFCSARPVDGGVGAVYVLLKGR